MATNIILREKKHKTESYRRQVRSGHPWPTRRAAAVVAAVNSDFFDFFGRMPGTFESISEIYPDIRGQLSLSDPAPDPFAVYYVHIGSVLQCIHIVKIFLSNLLRGMTYNDHALPHAAPYTQRREGGECRPPGVRS